MKIVRVTIERLYLEKRKRGRALTSTKERRQDN
jgi:hypothetical protein